METEMEGRGVERYDRLARLATEKKQGLQVLQVHPIQLRVEVPAERLELELRFGSQGLAWGSHLFYQIDEQKQMQHRVQFG
jgi:hypothetical protein